MKIMDDPVKDFLQEGDKVKLNISRIKSRKDYSRLQPEYKEFIEKNEDSVFTVHIYKKRGNDFAFLVELTENPKWLFIESDLIKVKNGEG